MDQSKEARNVVQTLTKLKGKKTQGITITTKTNLGCPIPFHDYLVYFPRGFTELLGTVDMITIINKTCTAHHTIVIEFIVAVAIKNKIINNVFSCVFLISSGCARFYYKKWPQLSHSSQCDFIALTIKK